MLVRQDHAQNLVQRIDPKIIQANTILQMSALELEQALSYELQENPALESNETVECDGSCVDPQSCPYCRNRLEFRETSLSLTPTDDADDLGTDRLYAFQVSGDPSDALDNIGNVEAETTLQEHLLSLMRAALSTEDQVIGEYLIQSLDDRGWLDGKVEMIALDLRREPEEIERVLAVIHTFDPAGVGARNLRECLLLQLRSLLEEPDQDETVRGKLLLAQKMLEERFDDVSTRKISRLARALKVKAEVVQAALDVISSHLNPYPAAQFRPHWNYRPSQEASIRPDVILRRTELGYEVDVVGFDSRNLTINASYLEYYEGIKSNGDAQLPEVKRQVVEQVERARRYIQCLAQRRQTMRKITMGLAELQIGYLETGQIRFLRQLTRTQLAQQLNLHESTVSRATMNKYIQLPNMEVVSFDVFFNSSLSIADAIQEIIDQEDLAKPYSDQQIVHLLAERGINVARRTVVKYRESRKILSSTHRRR